VAIPALAIFPSPGVATPGIMAAALALGVMCTGIAYMIYFKLIADVGATSALTVTFLNPIFGIMWGAIFLGEVIGWYTILGCATVLVGTAMVTGYRPKFMQ
jgi:drug/metabolite transporter (DMT)-like permease